MEERGLHTIHFWTMSASRDHFVTAYSFTTCFFHATTKSASLRFRALSDMPGRLDMGERGQLDGNSRHTTRDPMSWIQGITYVSAISVISA